MGPDLARGPLRGISVMPWGMSPSSNIRRLLQVPKTDTPISKVGPLSVKNNPKGPYLHGKSSKAIIIDPLRKAINKKRMGEERVGHWRGRNKRVREGEKETKNKPPQEEGRQLYFEYGLSSLGTSHCKISIHPLQQINYKPNKTVSPLTVVRARTIYIHIDINLVQEMIGFRISIQCSYHTNVDAHHAPLADVNFIDWPKPRFGCCGEV